MKAICNEAPPAPTQVLPDFKAAAVTGIRIIREKGPQIRAVRTNDVWVLDPDAAPAQYTNVDNLLTALEHLKPETYITLQELQGRPDVDEQFGFATPQASLTLQQGVLPPSTLVVGAATAPGNQVFVEVVGQDGIFVVDAAITNLIPRSMIEWRDKTFANLARMGFDSVLVTNASGVLELQQDPTNKLWRIAQPDHYRADSNTVAGALQQIQDLRVFDFLPDAAAADLDALGLQPPALDVAFRRGSNVVLRLQFGKSPTNNPLQVYARRADQAGVVVVSHDALAPWRGSYEVFRDRHLVNWAGPLDRIESHAPGEDFTLQRRGTNQWWILPQDYPADLGFVEQLIKDLTTNQAVAFAKDVVTAPLLSRYGLATPARQFVLETARTNADGTVTNVPVARVDFGVADGKVYAQRADENSVYTVDLGDYVRLPSSLQMREHRIGDFDVEDVVRVVSRQGGSECTLDRKGTNHWSFGGHSQGILEEAYSYGIEETMRRLGELRASVWVAHGAEHKAEYGFATNSFQLQIELKGGRTWSLDFGGQAPSGYQYASIVLDGTPWIFEFPPTVYSDLLPLLWQPCQRR